MVLRQVWRFRKTFQGRNKKIKTKLSQGRIYIGRRDESNVQKKNSQMNTDYKCMKFRRIYICN